MRAFFRRIFWGEDLMQVKALYYRVKIGVGLNVGINCTKNKISSPSQPFTLRAKRQESEKGQISLHCGIWSPELLQPVRRNQPGAIVEEQLGGDDGKGEGDDQGGEEEGLKETGDNRGPAKRLDHNAAMQPTPSPATPALCCKSCLMLSPSHHHLLFLSSDDPHLWKLLSSPLSR